MAAHHHRRDPHLGRRLGHLSWYAARWNIEVFHHTLKSGGCLGNANSLQAGLAINSPETPPPLGEAMRMVAKLGGFLGRQGDGHPGATTLWRGLDRLADITSTFTICHPPIPAGP